MTTVKAGPAFSREPTARTRVSWHAVHRNRHASPVLQRSPFMTRYLAPSFVVASTLCFGGVAHAADAEFLKSLDGNWAGKGSVKVEADSSPISVNCKFASDTTESSMSLDGKCTGLVVVSRAIGADHQDRRQILQGHLYRLEHRSGRPQRQALGQCAQPRHPLGEGRERRPLRQAAAGEGRRQWHAADDDRYRSGDRARASSSARSTCAACEGMSRLRKGLDMTRISRPIVVMAFAAGDDLRPQRCCSPP